MRIIARTHITAAGRGYAEGAEVPAEVVGDLDKLVELGAVEVVEEQQAAGQGPAPEPVPVEEPKQVAAEEPAPAPEPKKGGKK